MSRKTSTPGEPQRPHHVRSAVVRGSVLLLLGAVAGQASTGCESNKNYDQREAYAATLPDDKPEGCLGTCTPDPGSPLADCEAEEAGLEFLKIWNFNLLTANNSGTDTRGFYTYTDRSEHNLEPREWESESVPIYRCAGKGLEGGFHITGGPFRSWGGGMGLRLDWVLWGDGNCGELNAAEYCPSEDRGAPFNRYTFDLSMYDGVSFWARRGPDGQPLLRVMIGDQRTDDDLSFLTQLLDPEAARFCERNRDCGCDNLPCTPVPPEKATELIGGRGLPAGEVPNLMACYDPKVDPKMERFQTYQYCGRSACDCPYEAFPTATDVQDRSGQPAPVQMEEWGDPQFYGRECTTFSLRGGITDKYCFNPGEDPDPVENSDLCGDHWTYPVNLTTEWKFYKVPFTKLLQQGWAKEQHQFDLDAISMLRFTWDKGNLDVWLDEVSFYRDAPPEAAAGAGSE